MKVRPVEGGRDLTAFVELPFELHGANPLWVPPLKLDVRARLSPAKNPFFEHGEAGYFLAEEGGRVVGRIAAIANGRHDEVYADGAGFFGFFDCIDDRRVATALFETAADWVRQRGYTALRGPTSFSTNDECGLLVDGFDTPPTLMMPHDPPYYAGLLEAWGLRKAKDLLAFHGDAKDRPPERTRRIAERLQRRLGVTLRRLDRRHFRREVARIKVAYNAAWERNWGFVPMSDREIDHMATQFRPFYLPDLVPFAEIDGRIVGFGLAVPDLNEILRHNRSGRLFPVVLRLLWAVRRRRITRARVMLLGILPEFRGKGLDGLLWHWIWSRAIENNVRWGEASWILEDNHPMCNAAERMGFQRYKTYRLYERAV